MRRAMEKMEFVEEKKRNDTMEKVGFWTWSRYRYDSPAVFFVSLRLQPNVAQFSGARVRRKNENRKAAKRLSTPSGSSQFGHAL